MKTMRFEGSRLYTSHINAIGFLFVQKEYKLKQLQASKLKKNSSRLLAIIKEKRSPKAKMQSLDNTKILK